MCLNPIREGEVDPLLEQELVVHGPKPVLLDPHTNETVQMRNRQPMVFVVQCQRVLFVIGE